LVQVVEDKGETGGDEAPVIDRSGGSGGKRRLPVAK
jgi:hypothetical protein